MTYTLPHVTEVPTVALEGEIDPTAVNALQRRISVALRAGQRRVVVDISAVSVLGAQTMSLFCAALRRMERRGAAIALVGAPTPVRRVIELCAIDGLELHPTVAAARRCGSFLSVIGTTTGGPPTPPPPHGGSPTSSADHPAHMRPDGRMREHA